MLTILRNPQRHQQTFLTGNIITQIIIELHHLKVESWNMPQIIRFKTITYIMRIQVSLLFRLDPWRFSAYSNFLVDENKIHKKWNLKRMRCWKERLDQEVSTLSSFNTWRNVRTEKHLRKINTHEMLIEFGWNFLKSKRYIYENNLWAHNW